MDTSPAPESARLRPHLIGAGRIKVVVIGGQGVGKTSLTHKIICQDLPLCLPNQGTLENNASDQGSGPEPTIGVDFSTRSVSLDCGTCPARLHLWDTSGQERFRSLAEGYIADLEDYDAVIAVFDTTRKESLEEAVEQLRRAKKLAQGTPQMSLVGTKADLTEQRAVTVAEGLAAAQELGALFVETANPPGHGDYSTARLPNVGVLSARSGIEDALLRPLLRRCREVAPPTAAPRCQATCSSQAERSSVHKCSRPLLRCLGLA
mmetsp:Transcript_13563/g.29840  ORF Transcript_13563/g.29840 Transcript_13563/m.29840 type:complete len:263 (-) Transcript_13563:109-897(-)